MVIQKLKQRAWEFINYVNGYKIFMNQKINDNFHTVVKCEKPNLDRQLCVKIIYKYSERRECEINKQIKDLKQKYLVEVIDIFSNEQNYFIVMELCQGGDLKKFIRGKEQPFNVKEILRFVYQFVQGYQDLYYNYIMHRDIKPENIFIDNLIFKVFKQYIKIGDFGVSRNVPNHDQALEYTQSGTYDYQAPQLFETSFFTPKCDMYSLGLILFEMAFLSFPDKGKYTRSQQFSYNLKYRAEALSIATNQLMPKSDEQINEKQELKYLIERLIMYDENQRMGFDELYDRILYRPVYLQFKGQFQVYQSLSDQLTSLTPFTTQDILNFIHQIVLEYNNNFKTQAKIHGKINPKTIIIQNGNYKLIGQGKDTKINQEQLVDRIVYEEQKNYWSPYMLRQVNQIRFCEKCDMYALGMIIYHMVQCPNPINRLFNPQQFTKTQPQFPIVYINTMRVKGSDEEKNDIKKIIEYLIMTDDRRRLSFDQLFDIVMRPILPSFNPIIKMKNIRKFLQNQQKKVNFVSSLIHLKDSLKNCGQFYSECENALLSGIIIGYKYNILLNMIAIYQGDTNKISGHLKQQEELDFLNNENDIQNLLLLKKEKDAIHDSYLESLICVTSIADQASTGYGQFIKQFNQIIREALLPNGIINQKAQYKQFSDLAEQFYSFYIFYHGNQLKNIEGEIKTFLGNGLIFASFEREYPQNRLTEDKEISILECSELNAHDAIMNYQIEMAFYS